MYTKNGRPLQVHGDVVYSRSGQVVGRISGDKVFRQDGGYVGTIDGDRLVYRSTDGAARGGSFSSFNSFGSGMANACGSATWGDEPDIPD